MKKIIFLSALVSFTFLSCKKEEVKPLGSSKPVKNTESAAKSLNCAPWEDVGSLAAAASDLNDVGVCNTSLCNGSYVNSPYPGMFTVLNSAGTAPLYFSYFSPPTLVTIATQNYMWGNAVSQAMAGTPTGYSVSKLHNFRTEVVTGGMIAKIVIKFDVIYIKCTDGGGSGEN